LQGQNTGAQSWDGSNVCALLYRKHEHCLGRMKHPEGISLLLGDESR
jgi:hypothetical protein